MKIHLWDLYFDVKQNLKVVFFARSSDCDSDALRIPLVE